MNLSEVARRLATPYDEPFLRSLFFAIRGAEFIRAGLSGEHLDLILNQQYQAMRSYYAQVFADAQYVIYEYEGHPIGYHATIDRDTFHLIDISIVEDRRNLGLGTAQMRELQTEAQQRGKPMTLSVEKFNPARNLYLRLGFTVIEDGDVYQRMRWESESEKSSRK